IAGQWTADEMATSFRSLHDLYNLRLVLQIVEEDERELDKYYFRMMEMMPSPRRLRRGYPFLPFLLSGMLPYSSVRANADDLEQLVKAIYPGEELRVRRIEFASPGLKDLVGLGEIVKQLRQFVQFLITLPQEHQRRRAEIDAARIENARKFAQL